MMHFYRSLRTPIVGIIKIEIGSEERRGSEQVHRVDPANARTHLQMHAPAVLIYDNSYQRERERERERENERKKREKERKRRPTTSAAVVALMALIPSLHNSKLIYIHTYMSAYKYIINTAHVYARTCIHVYTHKP